MEFRSKNLLITGGAGFIGSHFIKYIFNKYNSIKIINLDKLTYASNLDNLNSVKNYPNYTFIKGDICDSHLLEKIFEEYSIDGVINFAAESHVDNSIANPKIFIKSNINGVFNLLSTAYKFWFNSPFNLKHNFKYARFHQISTDEVYGSIRNSSFCESSAYSPNSPYSASKASADMLVRSFNKTYGLNTTISISTNNYGLNQNSEKLIPKVISCLKNNMNIPIYGDGKNIRDWIFVEDNSRAIDLIFNKSKPGEVFNVGGGNEFSNLELVNMIGKLSNITPKINFVSDRHGHDFRYSVNTSKIKRDLNFIISSDFEETFRKYLQSVL